MLCMLTPERGELALFPPQTQQKPRAPSVEVKAEWPVVSEIEFTQLAKLNYSPDEPQEL